MQHVNAPLPLLLLPAVAVGLRRVGAAAVRGPCHRAPTLTPQFLP